MSSLTSSTSSGELPSVSRVGARRASGLPGPARNPMLVAAVLLLLVGSARASRTEVGWIASFVGKRTDYKLVRQGRPVAVTVYGVLCENDRIFVKRNSAVIRIGIGEHDVTVGRKESPYRIQATGRVPQLPSNLMRFVATWLTWREGVPAEANVMVRG